MINAAPLKRLLAERELTLEFISQATGIRIETLHLFVKGQSITPETLNLICKTLDVQPKDVIEWSPTETKGHWVYVEEK